MKFTFQNLRNHGYKTVFIISGEITISKKTFAEMSRTVDIIYQRPNKGYDFGSWASALERLHYLENSTKVLLINDSIVGPFFDLDQVLSDFERCNSDVWTAVRSGQYFPHIQTFFWGFNEGVLSAAPIRHFWKSIPATIDREVIISKCELGISRLLFAEGFSTEAFIDPPDVGLDWENPTIFAWRGLIEAGFPFLKRQLLRRPELSPTGQHAIRYVQARFPDYSKVLQAHEI